MPKNNTKPDMVLEPSLVNERQGAYVLNLSPRAFREKVDAGEIRKIQIPGLRRVAFDLEELRSVARRWKDHSGPAPTISRRTR